jgi:ABC-2 type transport system ATP-binding protein
MTTPAVEVAGLHHVYPPAGRSGTPRTALGGVSFHVPAGTLFGFLGPNGSGKSTLLRILATLLAPQISQNGTVRVAGLPLPAERARVRRKLGVVFQNPSLDLQLTVAENLRCQGRLYGLGSRRLSDRIDALLDRFDLTERAGDRAEALSGGLRRRAEIAKALLHDPEILLLDEPSTGLDVRARREMWDILERLQTDGMTAIVSTHFVDEAERLDRLLLLDEGQIVAEGSPRGLTDELGGAVVTVTPRQGGDDDAEQLAAEVSRRVPDLPAPPTLHRGRVRFEHRDAGALVAELTDALGDRVDSIAVARPTLEDVFLARTGRGLDEDREPAP